MRPISDYAQPEPGTHYGAYVAAAHRAGHLAIGYRSTGARGKDLASAIHLDPPKSARGDLKEDDRLIVVVSRDSGPASFPAPRMAPGKPTPARAGELGRGTGAALCSPLISRPTTKKNTTISASFTQWCRSPLQDVSAEVESGLGVPERLVGAHRRHAEAGRSAVPRVGSPGRTNDIVSSPTSFPALHRNRGRSSLPPNAGRSDRERF